MEDRAARALGLTLHGYAVQTLTELRGAFAAMTTARVQGLVVGEAFWGDYVQPIVELAAKSRLPAVYPGRVFVEAGGLLSYDANDEATRRRLGDYVDKIFHGAKPGDLPVEQPTKFDLLVNLKTAKTLGLTIPPAVLARADEVIQ